MSRGDARTEGVVLEILRSESHLDADLSRALEAEMDTVRSTGCG
jgi:hypothetical protein